MDAEKLLALLERVRSGEVSVESALGELEHLPFENLGYARVDHHRALRLGMPEVILGQAKTPEQIVGIARRLVQAGQNVLVTRLDAHKAERVLAELPGARYSPLSHVATLEHHPPIARGGAPVAIVAAGTSDLPVAEEAAEALRMAGVAFERVFDVGVAGIHRLIGELPILRQAPALIVVAGMEGALPSVVGGLVSTPIVAVPTSVGYGVALGGLTALFGMLTSCASGITVVNIDNGFGAAMAVLRMVRAGARG
jgi:NCAIR mutase (PurE)-related protein